MNQENETKQEAVIDYDLTKADFAVVDISDTNLVEQGMNILKKKYSVVNNADTKEGYELNRAGTAVLRTLRGQVTARTKELKAPHIKKNKALETAKQALISGIEGLENPMKDANKAVDDRIEKEKAEKQRVEQARIDSIENMIDAIRQLPPGCMDKTWEEIDGILTGLVAEKDGDFFEEYKDKSVRVIDETVERLNGMVKFKKDSEAARKILDDAAKKAKEVQEAEDKEKEEKRLADEAKLKADKEKLGKDQADLAKAKLRVVQDKQYNEKAAQKNVDDKKDADDAAQKLIDDKKKADEVAKDEVGQPGDELESEKPMPDITRNSSASLNIPQSISVGNVPVDSEKEIDQTETNASFDEAVNSILPYVESQYVAENVVEAIIDGNIKNVTFG